MEVRSKRHVDFLILGAGWTSTFLIPLLKSSKISYAATTTNGRDGTIRFRYDPESNDVTPYQALPLASTILITFPLVGTGQSMQLLDRYTRTHQTAVNGETKKPNWIQLGSSGIFTNSSGWNNHRSPYDKQNARAIAEDELLSLPDTSSTVLNLAGLYDDNARNPTKWISRVAKSKSDVYGKKAVHLIHGADVARGIVAVHQNFERVKGERWILTDLWVYDWWGLMMDWGGKLEDGMEVRRAVFECMQKDSIKALPRPPDSLGRVVTSIEFWVAVGVWPTRGRVN
jgi:hypothetical protein